MKGKIMEKQLRILHISDIHLLENKALLAIRPELIYGTEGASYQRMKSLTKKINELEFDLVLVTGDYTTMGEKGCYPKVKKWLEQTITPEDMHIKNDGSTPFGLNLIEKDIEYITIPGNHDYFFNGVAEQVDCTHYTEAFRDSKTRPFKKGEEYLFDEIEIKNGLKIRLHRFDSNKIATKAHGIIKTINDIDIKTGDDTLDIAMLHHHCLYTYNLRYEKITELVNGPDVLNKFIEKKMDAILYGHTHVGYLNYHSHDEMRKMAKPNQHNDDMPDMHQNKTVPLEKNHTVISMAASACNSGNKVCGFNMITYDLDKNTVLLEEYFYNNVGFVKRTDDDNIIPET